MVKVKFNTPSLEKFAQQSTPANSGGQSTATKTQTKKVSTASDVTTTGSGDAGTQNDSQASDGKGAEANEQEEVMHVGFLKEWTLMLHGTREPPYGQLSVRDPHSKLAIVKKAHTISGPETTVSPQQQSAY